jgi:hypothetical protein
LKKITIELPEDLLIAAKKRAAELRRPLRQLIEDGLRQQLPAKPSKRMGHKKIRWIVSEGGLPRGLDVSDRVAMYSGEYQLMPAEQMEAQTLEGIRRGLEDVKHGRTRTARTALKEIRRSRKIPRKA